MAVFYTVLTVLGGLLLGYLFGSIPNAVIVSKAYGIDIRQYGSHNAGGTNVGRTLGKFPGILTMILDILKSYVCLLLVYILLRYTPLTSYLVDYDYLIEMIVSFAAMGVSFGHIYPIFAHFKGGKTVAVYAGYVLFISPAIFAVGALIFFSVFFATHKISMCSLIAAPSVALLSIIPMVLDLTIVSDKTAYDGGMYFAPDFMIHIGYWTFIMLSLLATILIYRHRANLKRIKEGVEPETHFQNTINK